MQEDYLMEKMIRGKSDKEKEIELMRTIIETKEMLKVARSNFEYAEDDLIDYYTYQIKANQSKLDYLIKIAKRKGIVVSRLNELKTNFKIHLIGTIKILQIINNIHIQEIIIRVFISTLSPQKYYLLLFLCLFEDKYNFYPATFLVFISLILLSTIPFLLAILIK